MKEHQMGNEQATQDFPLCLKSLKPRQEYKPHPFLEGALAEQS
jgi:hypothetical protein